MHTFKRFQSALCGCWATILLMVSNAFLSVSTLVYVHKKHKDTNTHTQMSKDRWISAYIESGVFFRGGIKYEFF